MLTKNSFKCKRCAECCKYTIVKLFKEDIERIKKAGYKEDFFVRYDSHIKSPVLRNEKGSCVFLEKKKGKYQCKIYDIRPRVCRLYPFVESDEVEDCKPQLLRLRFGK